MSNNQTKELEQKIEEIMSKGTWEEAGDFYNMYFVLEHDFPKLLTLISQSQVEAIEGFVDNIVWKKPSEVIDLADDVIDGRSLVKQMEAYLQSLESEK
jgi:hypothetical protein